MFESKERPTEKQIEILLSIATTKTDLESTIDELRESLGSDYSTIVKKIANRNREVGQKFDILPGNPY